MSKGTFAGKSTKKALKKKLKTSFHLKLNNVTSSSIILPSQLLFFVIVWPLDTSKKKKKKRKKVSQS